MTGGRKTSGLLLRCNVLPVGLLPPNLMTVLRDVCKVREIAKGSRDKGGRFGCQSLQGIIELMPGLEISFALKGDAEAADGFDALEDVFALLLANGVSKNLAEHTDVLDER